MPRSAYSRWDGTQEVADLEAAGILRHLSDDLFEHGDLDQALRRLMQQGWSDDQGSHVAGLRELFERARRRRAELAAEAFSRMQRSLSNTRPGSLHRTREMLSELNNLVERQQAGEDVQPDFEGFRRRYGDLLPGSASSLDELLATLAHQMVAVRQLLESMTPQQRAKLAELSEAILDELGPGLQAEIERLGANLAASSPGGEALGLPAEIDPGGLLASGLFLPDVGPGLSTLAGEAGDLLRLEQLLSAAPSPGALAEIDINRARELLGGESARSLEALGQLASKLRTQGLAEQRGGRLRLTPKGLRRIASQALSDLYDRLGRFRAGQHPSGYPGVGHERAGETTPYEWGDPLNLSIERTLRNTMLRCAEQGHPAAVPLKLAPGDFEVERTEALTRAATVIMLDLSLSMPMRGNFLAAKKMAMALHALISSQFPSDYLGLVGFSRSAREINFADLPAVSWDYDWGTNIQHGLALARRLLAHQGGTKQVVMVTDGEPTACWRPGESEPVFAYPPTQEIVDATLLEVARCTREGVRVNTFALDATGHLRRFVEELARLNQGRAFFTTPEALGDYVLVDFLDARRQLQPRSHRHGPS